jgi:hypothetical protein
MRFTSQVTSCTNLRIFLTFERLNHRNRTVGSRDIASPFGFPFFETRCIYNYL